MTRLFPADFLHDLPSVITARYELSELLADRRSSRCRLLCASVSQLKKSKCNSNFQDLTKTRPLLSKGVRGEMVEPSRTAEAMKPPLRQPVGILDECTAAVRGQALEDSFRIPVCKWMGRCRPMIRSAARSLRCWASLSAGGGAAVRSEQALLTPQRSFHRDATSSGTLERAW
jgi:hypothetical protein